MAQRSFDINMRYIQFIQKPELVKYLPMFKYLHNIFISVQKLSIW